MFISRPICRALASAALMATLAPARVRVSFWVVRGAIFGIGGEGGGG